MLENDESSGTTVHRLIHKVCINVLSKLLKINDRESVVETSYKKEENKDQIQVLRKFASHIDTSNFNQE